MDGGIYALKHEDNAKLGRVMFVCEAPAPAATTTGSSPMHIASAGRYLGHPAGAFEWTAEIFDAAIARFQQRKLELQVDYMHKTSRAQVPEDGIAAGWIKRLYRKGAGALAELWADVEYTARAGAMVAAREFKYVSPEIDFAMADARTGDVGPEIVRVSLTNTPFQEGLEPLKLARFEGKPGDDEEPKGKDAAPTSKGEEPPAVGDADPPVDGEPPPVEGAATDPQQLGAEPTPIAQRALALVQMIGGELTTDEASVMNALEKNAGAIVKAIGIAIEKSKETAAMADQALLDRVAALETKLNEGAEALKLEREERAKDKAAARVDGLIKLGRVLDSQRDMAIREFHRDATAADAMFPAQVVPTGSQAGGNDGDVTTAKKLSRDELTDVEKAVFKMMTDGQRLAPAVALERISARREN